MRNGVEKRLFIAATSQNDGKTTCAVGLLKAFSDLAESIGFIKPVGQRCVTVDGQQIDEDTVLVQKACGLTCALKCMSPVTVGRAFTRKFLDDPQGIL
ncbi:MAG: dethiobiotin synthase, partial [Kiritimatiellota bacterium]|nr:dethiobiotin synthase [Kiritimatiellota bacterium]